MISYERVEGSETQCYLHNWYLYTKTSFTIAGKPTGQKIPPKIGGY